MLTQLLSAVQRCRLAHSLHGGGIVYILIAYRWATAIHSTIFVIGYSVGCNVTM